jgi:hypothetical protein
MVKLLATALLEAFRIVNDDETALLLRLRIVTLVLTPSLYLDPPTSNQQLRSLLRIRRFKLAESALELWFLQVKELANAWLLDFLRVKLPASELVATFRTTIEELTALVPVFWIVKLDDSSTAVDLRSVNELETKPLLDLRTVNNETRA